MNMLHILSSVTYRSFYEVVIVTISSAKRSTTINTPIFISVRFCFNKCFKLFTAGLTYGLNSAGKSGHPCLTPFWICRTYID